MKTYKLTSNSGTVYSANTEKDGRSLDFSSIGITVNGSPFRKAHRSEVEAIFSMLAMSALGLVPNGWVFEVIDNEEEQAKAAMKKVQEEEAAKRLRRSNALCEISKIANDARNGPIVTDKADLTIVAIKLQGMLDNYRSNI